MMFPAAIFWCLAVWAMFSNGPLFAYLPWLCLAFGALAVIDPSLTFNSTILPITAAIVVFVVKVASRREARLLMWRSAIDIRGLGLFSIFAVYAVVSAYVCPRLFAGQVNVLPLRMTVVDAFKPLAPTTANFTQAAYTVLSWLFALAMLAYLRTGDGPTRQQSLVKAMFWGGAILAITGLVDFLGGRDSLEFLRNGTYAIQGYTQIGNYGRITGAFPEASAFGGATVVMACLLYFCRPILSEGSFKTFLAPAIVAMLFFLAAAATSSSAYAGLAVTIICIGYDAADTVFSGHMHKNLIGLGVVAFVLLAFVIALIFIPDIFTSPLQLLNQAVLQKSSTQSYIERNFWTATGYHVFWETWGVGAGAGATRVSSWPASVASNLGMIGIISMAGLIIQTYLRRPRAQDFADQRMRKAAKALLAASLAMGYFAATTLDPGMSVALALSWVLVTSDWHPDRAKATAHRRTHPLMRNHSYVFRKTR